jgi:hypothetical protein
LRGKTRAIELARMRILLYPNTLTAYPIQPYPTPSHPTKSYPILPHPILSYPIVFYPIVFYPILLYSNLSYPFLSYSTLLQSTHHSMHAHGSVVQPLRSLVFRSLCGIRKMQNFKFNFIKNLGQRVLQQSCLLCLCFHETVYVPLKRNGPGLGEREGGCEWSWRCSRQL